MTVEDVEERINQLKRTHGAETDAELAKVLQVGRSTVATWRARGSVPARYALRKPGEDQSFGSFPITEWSREEMAALSLAILRITHGKSTLFADYHGYLKESGRVVVDLLNEIVQAKHDILDRMRDEKDMLPETAGQLLAYRVFNPDQSF